MLDATNAAAEAKGEAVPSDFFGSLDKDKARSTLVVVVVGLLDKE